MGSVLIGTSRPRVKRRSSGSRRSRLTDVTALRTRDAPWAVSAALLLTGSTVGLAFHDGGYFGGATAVVAVLSLALLAARVLVARSPLRGLTRGGLVAGAALLGLCGWTLASQLWSDAPGRALMEGSRTLTYATVFVLFASLRGGTRSARLVLRAVAGGLGVVVVFALAARLAPDVLDVARAQQDTRMSWPLGYWNGLGLAAAACALAGLALATDEAEHAAVRTLAAALVPLGTVALYLTLSRGAVAAAAVALLVLILARGWRAVPGLLAAGAPTAAALAVAAAAPRLNAPDLTSAATVAQGHRVAAALVLATCAAMALQLPALWLAQRVRAPRWFTPGVRRGGWFATVAVLLVAAVVAGGAVWDQVTAKGFSAPVAQQRDRLASADTNGRIDQWRIAARTFADAPVTGVGAGLYGQEWLRERPFALNARDAHSLPLETAAELGGVGLLLLALALGVPLLSMLRRVRTDPVWAGALALAVLWLVHACVDWDWELPAVTLWAVALLGAGVGRARSHGASPAPSTGGRPPVAARVGAVAALIAVAVAVPVAAGASQRDLTAALAAFRAGDCTRSTDRALAAAAHAGGRSEPFELLAYCDVQTGEDGLGRRAVAAAVRRDPGNWQLRYAQGLVAGATGADPRPALRAARAENPLRPEPEALLAAVEAAAPGRWPALARRAPLPLPR